MLILLIQQKANFKAPQFSISNPPFLKPPKISNQKSFPTVILLPKSWLPGPIFVSLGFASLKFCFQYLDLAISQLTKVREIVQSLPTKKN